MCGRQSKVGRISSSPLSFRRRLIILFLFSSQFPFFLLLILSIYLFIYFWGFGFKRFFIMGAGSLGPLGIFHISFGRVSKFAPPPPHPQMRNWEIFRLRRVSWKMWLDFRVELEFLMAHFDVITMRTRFKRGRKQTIEKSICNLQKVETSFKMHNKETLSMLVTRDVPLNSDLLSKSINSTESSHNRMSRAWLETWPWTWLTTQHKVRLVHFTPTANVFSVSGSADHSREN